MKEISGVTKAVKDNDIANSPKISLVIPIRDEASNLPYVLPKIPPVIDEVIVVDGHSKDNSIEVAKKLLPHVKVVNQDGAGKGNALKCGFESATGDYIIQMDADGSMDPAELIRYIEALNEGYDLVKGSRMMRGGGSEDITPIRAIGNMAFTKAINIIFGTHYSDTCYEYIGMKRKALEKLKLRSDGFNIEAEMVIRSKIRGLKVKEIPSTEYNRINGDSHLNAVRDGVNISKIIMNNFIEFRLKGNVNN